VFNLSSSVPVAKNVTLRDTVGPSTAARVVRSRFPLRKKARSSAEWCSGLRHYTAVGVRATVICTPRCRALDFSTNSSGKRLRERQPEGGRRTVGDADGRRGVCL
jgi:hypothetical protein